MMLPAADKKIRGRCVADASMARYNSWRTGGNAGLLFFPEDIEDLSQMLVAQEDGIEVHFVGLGSNLLVRDGGVRGLVVRTAPGLSRMEEKGSGYVYAEAGVAMPKLSRFVAGCGLGGAGFMAGIPGTVGGALAMNAGCFGTSTWERVQRAWLIDGNGVVAEKTPDQFEIGYRHVAQQGKLKMRFVAAEFSFPPRRKGEDEKDAMMLRKRDSTQPIGSANAGSVFKNPVGDSAGRLIEQAGLAGHSLGDAVVSTKHCNFIINSGNATSADIEKLIHIVREKTLEKTGTKLELEVRIIGDAA